MATKTPPQRLRAVGEYEILERLASSDSSTTFKARHADTGELVALKVATSLVMQNPVLLKRFEQEYTLLRGLDHPHLVHTLGRGYHGEIPYLLLEHVEGGSLGERIERQGKLAEAEAVRLITQVGEALHYAHQHRIIHRNVKPDNILLGDDSTAKLADLGLAKDCEVDAYLTRPSSTLGTPNFMAPEQFQDARSADRRCDLYSLAATLYMTLTGELPYRGRGLMSILKKKLDNDLAPPRKLVPEISPWVEAALLRALDVNAKVRHASCSEFLDEINGLSQLAQGQVTAQVSVSRDAKQPASATGKSNRRAAKRFPSQMQGFCETVQGKKGGCWEVLIQDVSADGVGLVVSRRFEPRTVLLLELNPTAESPGRRLLVRVVRSTPLQRRRWLLGCDFGVRLNDEEVRSLL
jgi:serine/threonine protein kinase